MYLSTLQKTVTSTEVERSLVKQLFSYHPQLNKWLSHLLTAFNRASPDPSYIRMGTGLSPTLGGDKEGVHLLNND